MTTIQSILQFLQEYPGIGIVLTVAAIMVIEWIGRQLSLWLIGLAFGRKAALDYDSKCTAIGVVHHELAHLIFALLTGAKIEGVCLYKLRRKDDDGILGYVNYTARGIFLLPTIQKTLIGIAPAILGSLNTILLGSAIRHLWLTKGIAAFADPRTWIFAILMSQIAYHSCPSKDDIRGSIISILLFTQILACLKYTSFSVEFALWIIETVGVAVAMAAAPAIAVSLAMIIARSFSHLKNIVFVSQL